MRRKIVILAASLVVILGACATTVKTENQGNGTCIQTTNHKVFGINTSSDQNLVNCNP